MKSLASKFSFKVPETHAEGGKKIEKSFEYQECETVVEADKVIADKKWSVLEMVNEALKAAARSNAYQAALLPYKPSEVPAEDVKERMIRDMIRLGIAEDVARAQVDSLLAASGQTV